MVLEMSRYPEHIARISVDQYHKMIDTGVLSESDRIELLDGFLVPKMTNNPLHAGTIQQLSDLLKTLLPQNVYHVRTQLPITLKKSEPEPDIIVALPDKQHYTTRHPHVEDVLLVIEVADSSLKQDQTTKLEIYAEAGIPWYWIVNLQNKVIEVYSQPIVLEGNPTYRNREQFRRQDLLPIMLTGKEVSAIHVADFLF